MPDNWDHALQKLDRVTNRMQSLDPSDLPSLAELLAERGAAVAAIARHVGEQAPASSVGAGSVERIREAAHLGTVLACKLKLQLAALRQKMALLQHEKLVAQALAAPDRDSCTRLRCVG
jgi:hypothetical protein